jgi:hypothetical protein
MASLIEESRELELNIARLESMPLPAGDWQMAAYIESYLESARNRYSEVQADLWVDGFIEPVPVAPIPLSEEELAEERLLNLQVSQRRRW